MIEMTEHKDFNMMSIYEYMIGIGTDLVFIEKLQKLMFNVSRSNIKEDSHKEMLFLKKGQNSIDKSIRNMEKMIDWIKKEIEAEEERQSINENVG